jgi:hypothetical protein
MRVCSALISLVLIAACGATAGDKSPEKPVRLPRYEVNERAFGIWGVALRFDASLLNLFLETAPARGPYTVYYIIRDSPGHRAGLSVGDQVIAAEGRPCEKIAIGEMRKLFYETESGKPLTLRVRAPLESSVREVTLKPDLSKAWRERKPQRYVYWSIDVVPAPHENLRTDFQSTKMATRVQLDWHGPALYLAPRDDGGVDWWRRRGPRTTLSAGSVLELHDDGTATVRPPGS